MKQFVPFPLLMLLVAACAKQPAPPPENTPHVTQSQAVPQAHTAPQEKAAPMPVQKKLPVIKKLPQKENKVVLGWVERVTLSGSSHTVKAKLDSGAKTSSVDAEIIKTFKRDGQNYVLYRVMLDEDISETYESRIIRWVRIKKKDGGFQRRPVVKMQFCLGKKKISGEVSLAERGHFIYPVLVGRNMLEKGNILVDTSRTFLTEPECKK